MRYWAASRPHPEGSGQYDGTVDGHRTVGGPLAPKAPQAASLTAWWSFGALRGSGSNRTGPEASVTLGGVASPRSCSVLPANESGCLSPSRHPEDPHVARGPARGPARDARLAQASLCCAARDLLDCRKPWKDGSASSRKSISSSNVNINSNVALDACI